MRLQIECEHGSEGMHDMPSISSDPVGWSRHCLGGKDITDPDAILEALREAGVLRKSVDRPRYRYVSPWKEAK